MSLLFYSIAYTEPFYFKTTIDEGRGQAWEASKILNKGRRPLNKTLLTAHTHTELHGAASSDRIYAHDYVLVISCVDLT